LKSLPRLGGGVRGMLTNRVDEIKRLLPTHCVVAMTVNTI